MKIPITVDQPLAGLLRAMAHTPDPRLNHHLIAVAADVNKEHETTDEQARWFAEMARTLSRLTAYQGQRLVAQHNALMEISASVRIVRAALIDLEQRITAALEADMHHDHK